MTESMYQPPPDHETVNALGQRPPNELSQPKAEPVAESPAEATTEEHTAGDAT